MCEVCVSYWGLSRRIRTLKKFRYCFLQHDYMVDNLTMTNLVKMKRKLILNTGFLKAMLHFDTTCVKLLPLLLLLRKRK
jgi:hypothetical protein